MGEVSRLNNFFGTGKEEGDGKADNYRVRRMFSFRIQKMLGDLAVGEEWGMGRSGRWL